MHRSTAKALVFTFFWVAFIVPSLAQLPKRDLAVEVRQVEGRDPATSVVGTQTAVPALIPQRIVVRNGEKATVRFNASIPVLWTQRMDGQGNGAQTGPGVTKALHWMDAGQSMVVTPRWSSAKQPVVVEIEILTAAVDERSGAEVPNQLRSQTATTVSAPLGEWTTIATEGQASQPGVYSSAAGSSAPRAIQLRVTAN